MNPAPLAPSLGGTVASLVLVLGLIVTLAWLLRRLPRAGLHGQGLLRVRASLALGMKERLVLVEAGGENLLLAVSTSGVTCVHRFNSPPPDPAAETGAFTALLRRRADERREA